MNKDLLSGIIPKLFKEFWQGNYDCEQVIKEHINEEGQNNNREDCIYNEIDR